MQWFLILTVRWRRDPPSQERAPLQRSRRRCSRHTTWNQTSCTAIQTLLRWHYGRGSRSRLMPSPAGALSMVLAAAAAQGQSSATRRRLCVMPAQHWMPLRRRRCTAKGSMLQRITMTLKWLGECFSSHVILCINAGYRPFVTLLCTVGGNGVSTMDQACDMMQASDLAAASRAFGRARAAAAARRVCHQQVAGSRNTGLQPHLCPEGEATRAPR